MKAHDKLRMLVRINRHSVELSPNKDALTVYCPKGGDSFTTRKEPEMKRVLESNSGQIISLDLIGGACACFEDPNFRIIIEKGEPRFDYVET